MRLEISDPTLGTSEAGRCWTRTNASEACPEVMTPFCWTFWQRISHQSVRQAWYDFGLIAKREIHVAAVPDLLTTGCFYGRQAVNVDAVRKIIALAPGTSPEDFERETLGYVRADAPPVRQSRRRYPVVAVKLPQAALRQHVKVQRLHDDQYRWWRAEVVGEAATLSPRELLVESERRFQDAMRLHLYARTNLLPALQGHLTVLATSVGGPQLVSRLLSGSGRTAETQIAHDLWSASRGLLTRTELLAKHGFHGPSEGNPVSRSWREDATQIDLLVAAYERLADEESPEHLQAASGRAHAAAIADLMSAIGPARRVSARILLRAFRAQVRFLGLGKAAFLMGLDGARAGVRAIGAELVAAGVTDEPDDAFYLTFDEILGPVPDNFAEVVAHRRACRIRYQQLDLPVTWTGMPEPIELSSAYEPAPTVIVGSPGSGGVVSGRVRVVIDPADSDELESGEVLVCHFTDPAWAALFPMAGAVVIDIGGPASHGAVVARELGIPCVIGTGSGTRVLRTGDLVHVDGSAGTVTVLTTSEDERLVP